VGFRIVAIAEPTATETVDTRDEEPLRTAQSKTK
jgi:hypothetical protein